MSFRACPECSSPDVAVMLLDTCVPYGHPVEIRLTVNIPVHRCRTCAFEWTDKVAEATIDEAVEEYLKAKKEGCANG